MISRRINVLLIGTAAGTAYAFTIMLLVQQIHQTVSVGYIFIMPILLGAIPVLMSTKAQLKAYWKFIIIPILSITGFFLLSLVSGFEGIICLIIIVGPFLILGTLGAFIFRMIKLKRKGDDSDKLYISLIIPVLVLLIELMIVPSNHIETVTTKMVIESDRGTVWENIKNVRDIKDSELEPHFIQLMGIPKPMNGELDREGIGGTRHITWQKGLKFKEITTRWNDGYGFDYKIIVNTDGLKPRTLDEHVMIGGRYFDVFKGSYDIKPIDSIHQEIVLTSTYRITSTVNFYGRIWTNFIIDDFQESVLEVIKKRSENKKRKHNTTYE